MPGASSPLPEHLAGTLTLTSVKKFINLDLFFYIGT